MPTLLAAAGDPNVVAELEQGHKFGNKTFKIHPDGYNFVPYLKGQEQKGPRHEIYYFEQGGDLDAIRYDDWKVMFASINGNDLTDLLYQAE
jgi:arylsulfatase